MVLPIVAHVDDDSAICILPRNHAVARAIVASVCDFRLGHVLFLVNSRGDKLSLDIILPMVTAIVAFPTSPHGSH